MATVAAAASPALLSACGSSPVAGGSGDSATTTFLSAIPLETLSLAPELLAVAGGYFSKHGLDVTLQPANGTSQAMQTLIAGVGPVTRIGQIDLMTELSESQRPLVNIGTMVRGASVRLVYSKQNPLTRPQDFVGKTIGVPSEGGTSSKTVSLVLASASLDPTSTSQQVVGLSPGTFTLVQQGRIAGYVVSIDTANILRAQHDDVGVFDPSSVVQATSQVYVSTTDVIGKNPDTLKAFLASIDDAVAAIVADDNFDKTIATLRKKYSFAALDNEEAARQSLGMLRELWTGEDPSQQLLVTDKTKWLNGYKELAAAGMAKPGGDAASWFTNSLLPKPTD